MNTHKTDTTTSLQKLLEIRETCKETIAKQQQDLFDAESRILGILIDRGDSYFFNINWKRVDAAVIKGQLD